MINDDLRSLYQAKSTKDLLLILNNSADYQSNVIELVSEILANRDLTDSQKEKLSEIKLRAEVETEEKEEFKGVLDNFLLQLVHLIHPFKPKSDKEVLILLTLPILYSLYLCFNMATLYVADFLSFSVFATAIIFSLLHLYLVIQKKKWGLYIYIVSVVFAIISDLFTIIAHLILHFKYSFDDVKDNSGQTLFDLFAPVDYMSYVYWGLIDLLIIIVVGRLILSRRVTALFAVDFNLKKKLILWSSILLGVGNIVMLFFIFS